ncbi:MAG: A/G-specific adenine glycosylase [Flavobacteriales bacterium]|jgi:A/G-specific adenine glycosylase|nr:A/G-specific adenine glycosylase [Flavobacteriales bacterium]MBT6964870.1 A/G-specific adenine glycosylase [Flavobacteriales bacterium]
MDFSDILSQWYAINKRDLPWRSTVNPYYIWLSEIILQQTRVNQGLPYYLKFIDAFPAVADLANADEDLVLKLWQGLGYYSRARNLQFSAKLILSEFGGNFPDNHADILKLKGVGSYTAAAISSFSFGLPFAVLDGNVIRVLSRVFGIQTPFDTTAGKKQFQKLAQELLDKKNPAEYNQAIMEFGALQCVPKSPKCNDCPIVNDCIAFNTNTVSLLPVKSKKLKVKSRFLHFLVVNKNYEVLIGKRNSGIWQGLYEFPFLEFDENLNEKSVLKSPLWINFFKDSVKQISSISEEYIHKLSHQKIHAKFWEIDVNSFRSSDFKIVKCNELQKYPVSSLIEKYLNSRIND